MDHRKAYEYINSQAIREHLTKLDYPLTPVQCAFLVWQSKRHTMKQKHDAWNEIIETLPDCRVEERMNCRGWDSLHEMLRGYMAFEEKILARFRLAEDNGLYEYAVFEKKTAMIVPDGREYGWRDGNRHFRTLEACCRAAKEDAGEEKSRFRIIKHFMDTLPPDISYEPDITVDYDAAGHIMEVFLSGSSTFFSLTGEEEALWSCSFDGMWFDIPIPFEKGDIVCDNANIYCTGTPFVLMGTVPWFKKEHPSPHGTYYCDYSDMNAYGFSYDFDRQFFNDDFRVDYLDLEYCAEPLKGPERLLYACRQLERGEIDGYLLLKIYRMLMAEAAAEEERRGLQWHLQKPDWV